MSLKEPIMSLKETFLLSLSFISFEKGKPGGRRMEQKRAFFIGHRPEKLPWGRDTASLAFRCFYVRLAEAMEHAAASGFREFYTGMTEGVSLWAGEIVAGYKAAHPADGVRLVAVRPYQGQGRFRDPESRRLYGEVLAAADEAVVLSSTYTRHCMADANRYMLARCGLLVAGYDGHTPGGTANTVALAARQGRTVWRVDPSRLAPSEGPAALPAGQPPRPSSAMAGGA